MRKLLQIIRAALVAAAAGLLLTNTAYALEVGQKAPDFALPGPDGKPVKLADLLGKGPVVIYTFIQAFTGV
jgi:cytochrome oxidase Cu insertion factor (SCO1/SenC/PrrC family)